MENKLFIGKKGKVLLIHAPFKEHIFGDKWRPTPSLCPPIGLMYLASNLIKNGYEINFIDFNIDKLNLNEFSEIVRDKHFALITCFSDSLKNVNNIIKIIKSINKNIYIVCGGPYCNLSFNYINDSDITIVGEAEERISEILKILSSGKSLDGIPGLIYGKDGRLVKTSGFLEVKDINNSTRPYYELGIGKDYGDLFGYKLNNIVGVVSSRGCPYSCTFCTQKGILPYRERKVENVTEELKYLQKKGYKYVVFYDDNFLMNKNRVKLIMNRIISEKIKVKMIVQGRVDSADLEFYKLLRKAGVILILYGVESANQDVLDFYNKKISIAQIKKAIEMANITGILTAGYIILGAPMETEKHFKINQDFIRNVPLDFIMINILAYYQGSKLWEDAVKAGQIKEEQTIVLANEKLSNYSYKEWANLQKILLEGFYKNPRRIFRIIYKLINLGIFALVIRIVWNSRKDFFERIKSPFLDFSDLKDINTGP